jgi:hypothetical protein
MDNEAAHQPAEQQVQPTPKQPGEQENKASMQFIYQVAEGWVADDPYPVTPARQKRRSAPDVVSTGNRSRRIARAPGFRVVDVLGFFCRPLTLERVVVLHNKLLGEYYAALRERRERKAVYITFQMPYCLIKTVLGGRTLKFVGSVILVWLRIKSGK